MYEGSSSSGSGSSSSSSKGHNVFSKDRTRALRACLLLERRIKTDFIITDYAETLKRTCHFCRTEKEWEGRGPAKVYSQNKVTCHKSNFHCSKSELQNSFLPNNKLDFIQSVIPKSTKLRVSSIRRMSVEKTHGMVFDLASSVAQLTEVSRVCKVRIDSVSLYDTTVLK